MEYNYLNTATFHQRKYQFFKLYKYFLLDDSFRDLSSDAKIAYSLFENRHQSSMKNPDFKDSDGRPFIKFSRAELINALNCSTHKAADIIKELSNFGLIERSQKLGGFDCKKDIGQYRIYVNDYVDFIKQKKSKSKNGNYDTLSSRDFYMIPYDLFDNHREFFNLPTNVKITYSVLLNLCVLSFENESYHDESGNIFVKQSLSELSAIFGGESYCSKRTAMRYYDRLEAVGLIERCKAGMDNRIYVKNFLSPICDKIDTTAGDKTCTTIDDKTYTTVSDKTCTTIGDKTYTTVSDKTYTTVSDKTCTTVSDKTYTTEVTESAQQSCQNLHNRSDITDTTHYITRISNNQNDVNYTEFKSEKQTEKNVIANFIKEKLEVDDMISYCQQQLIDYPQYEDHTKRKIYYINKLYETVVWIFTTNIQTISISGIEISIGTIRNKLLEIHWTDIDVISSKLAEDNNYIKHLTNYLITALYNAVS